ncbi:MAG TPA: glycoside hydrolase family 2 TIM barrel-domain containing protein [Chloroflexota bacterium]|nr:glycoside hydrolase family 2 TIM barrel-domain containing protein [Chloroflexota bacterium]
MDHGGAVHPRPQMTRAAWTDLSGVWEFAYDDAKRGLIEGWHIRPDAFTRRIVVPFPPESSASGIGERGFHPIVWYRRTFTRPSSGQGERVLLHCGAVDYRAQVWVNGQLVATHEGGHTPFEADITAALHDDGEQVVVIRAEDLPDDLAQPRGKQDWEERPHRIWYHRTTGIWQPVWLEPVSATHITSLQWTPDLDQGMLGLSLALTRRDDTPLRLRVQLSLHGGLLADDTYEVQGSTLYRRVALDAGAMTMGADRILWTPKTPNLVDATLTLYEGERIVDEVRSYAGLRSVGVANGRFILNRRPYYLRLALEQGYWPESHLAAPSPEALRREVELVKELGFNGVRIHQKVEDPRFLYWCDRLGLLVWGEIANAYVFSPEAARRLMNEWTEAVTRDYSHPSIVAWVPLNESWGVNNLARDPAQQHYVQALYHLTKALDPTRPVIGNDGWEFLVGDVLGIHDYTFDGATLRQRYGSAEAVERTIREVQPGSRCITLPGHQRGDQPIMITEFGGISERTDPETEWFGYGTVGDRESFLTKYRELVDAILDSPVIAGFCYTQLTDTEQETNGLLTADRAHKLDPAAVRAITQRPSAAVPTEIIAVMQQAHSITSAANASAGVSERC